VLPTSGLSIEGCRAQGEEIFAASHLPILLFSSQKLYCCNLVIDFKDGTLLKMYNDGIISLFYDDIEFIPFKYIFKRDSQIITMLPT